MSENTSDTLKQLWKKEKDFYKTAEIGSGVQKFCHKVFQCSELFDLKEGSGSTKEIKRKNEFLEEAKKKGRRGTKRLKQFITTHMMNVIKFVVYLKQNI